MLSGRDSVEGSDEPGAAPQHACGRPKDLDDLAYLTGEE
jgi:hypothetical protein